MSDKKMQEALGYLSNYIRKQVATGFVERDRIVPDAVEVFADDYDAEMIRQNAERILPEVIDAQLREQASWPEVTDCDRLDAAFGQLEQAGIVCRQHFSCCGTCAGAQIWDEIEAERKKGREITGRAHYDVQMTDSAVDGDGLYLNYGSVLESETAAVEIGQKIADAMRAQGLTVDWNGSADKCIHVLLDWKRRLPESYTRKP